MSNGHDQWFAFRLSAPDDEGTQVLTFIYGGMHRGGISEGRMSWTGGTSVPFGQAIADRIARWVDEASVQPQTTMFGGLFSVPEPDFD